MTARHRARHHKPRGLRRGWCGVFCAALTLTRIQQAREQQEQQARVLALVDNLRGLLDGRKTRAEVLAWTRQLWPSGSDGRGPFHRWPEAATVFDSLWGLDEPWIDGVLVREVDLRGYLRWITEGECFHADEDQLFTIELDIDEFAAQIGIEAIRWWYEGLGWWSTIRFCTPAHGRPFVAHSTLSRPGWLDFYKRRSDGFDDSIVDLFEALAIDISDVSFVHAQVDRTRLPEWALWRQDDNGNRFEMARFHCYAKASAQAQMYTARGHRQLYWVEPA
jgi:hypothetical protein